MLQPISDLINYNRVLIKFKRHIQEHAWSGFTLLPLASSSRCSAECRVHYSCTSLPKCFIAFRIQINSSHAGTGGADAQVHGGNAHFDLPFNHALFITSRSQAATYNRPHGEAGRQCQGADDSQRKVDRRGRTLRAGSLPGFHGLRIHDQRRRKWWHLLTEIFLRLALAVSSPRVSANFLMDRSIDIVKYGLSGLLVSSGEVHAFEYGKVWCACMPCTKWHVKNICMQCDCLRRKFWFPLHRCKDQRWVWDYIL